MSTIVGALSCQKDSFLKTLTTTVVSCTEHKGHVTSKDKQNKNAKKVVAQSHDKKYAVELFDTVIFPEGGGQPCDMGQIHTGNEAVDVKEVIRNKLTALHITDTPLQAGTKVDLSIDWPRRFDHMQQHTGQHLVSAIFDQYDLPTLSWSLGETLNYVELPQRVDSNILKEINDKVNSVILQDVKITVLWPDGDGHSFDTSKLPEDYDLSRGLLRIVSIGDLDRNPCCGTHLNSTLQIQAVLILYQQNVRGGHSRVYFTCGSRVFSQLNKNFDILKKVAGDVLSCQIDEVYDKTKMVNDNYKDLNNAYRKLLGEIVALDAQRVFQQLQTRKLAWFYRKENNPEIFSLFQKELVSLINNSNVDIDLDKTHTVFMFNGQSSGMIKIIGPQAQELQNTVKQLIKNVKGGGKGVNFQAKVVYDKGELNHLLKYLDHED